MSRLLQEDLEAAQTKEAHDSTSCLITEVVVPGFDWDDHKYMTLGELKEMFGDSVEQFGEFSMYIKPEL